MAKTRQGGVLGRPNSLSTATPSGIWSPNDLAVANSQVAEEPGPKRFVTSNKFNATTNPQLDPYYDDVLMHITTEDVDWFGKDRSGKNWHWYMQKDSDYHTSPVVRSGPKYPYWSVIFPQQDGAGRINVSSNAGHSFGSDPFTIDFWYMRSIKDATERYIMGRGGQAARGSGAGWVVGFNTSYNLFFYDAVANVTHTISGLTTTADTWYFVSICRAGTGTNQFTINVNGTTYYTGTCASNFNDSNTLYIGTDRTATAATSFAGALADIRLTGNSTPTSVPTGPLDMTGAKYSHSISTRDWQSTKTVSNTPIQPQGYTQSITMNLYKDIRNPWEDDSEHAGYKMNYLTGKGSTSIYPFDSRGWMILDKNPNDTSLRFGTSAFTIEGWIYAKYDGGTTNCRIFGKGVDGSSGWCARPSESVMVWETGSTTLSSPNSHGDSRGVWVHFAYVRESTASNEFYMYYNGTRVYVGTDSSNYTDSENLYVSAGRRSAGGYHGYVSGLRISNNARYTGDSFTPDLETSLASDANTLYLIHSPENDSSGFPATNEPNLVDLGWGRFAHQNNITHGYAAGQAKPLGRWSQSLCNMVDYVEDCTVVKSDTSYFWDIDYGGKRDFSLELWVKPRRRDQARISCLVDFRPSGNWNANTISLHYAQQYENQGHFYLLVGGAVRLSGGQGQFTQMEWSHVCVTRIGDIWRLYVNGKLVDENYNSTALTNYNHNRVIIASGTYNTDYSRFLYGWTKDVRFDLSASAYPAGDTIPLPTSQLRKTDNTVFLVHGKYGMWNDTYKDYPTGTQVQVWTGYFDNIYYSRPNYGWGEYPGDTSPYNLRPAYDGYNPATDVIMDEIGGENWSASYSTCHYNRFLNYPTGPDTWYTRLDKPFTWECWFYSVHVVRGSPSGYTIYYTATSAGHSGIHLVSHYSSGSASFQRLNLRWFTGSSIYDYNTAYDFQATAMRGHAWNHVAFSFDPSLPSAQQWALWMNGYRQVLTTPPAPNNRSFESYAPYVVRNTVGIRLSTDVKYDHTQTTYDVPDYYTIDDTTFYAMGEPNQAWTNNRNTRTTTFNYGPVITDNCKMEGFGNNILMLSNDTVSNKINRLNLGNQNYGDLSRVMFPYEEWTLEFWAAWQPVAQGGKAFTTYQYMIDWINNIVVGLDSSGNWNFWRGATASDGGFTIYGTNPANTRVNTGVACALTTENRMDHICMCNKGNNIYCYVNGVLYGTLLNASWETSSYAANSNSPQYNYYGPTWSTASNQHTNYMRIGGDWHTRYDRTWQGLLNDFRFTRRARYENAVINGVNTMVHAGTRNPALPTQKFPKNELRAD